MYPNHISRIGGNFVLIIKNHSSLKRLVIHVRHRGGQDLNLAALDDAGGNYGMVVNLSPGVYEIVEPGHPELFCTLTIQ